MKQHRLAVTFQPKGKTVLVAAGATVREAAALAGIPIDSPCGGQGGCGKCRVRIVGEANPVTHAERILLGSRAIDDGMRLACQATVQSRVIVEVPEQSLLQSIYQILTHSDSMEAAFDDPVVRLVPVELSEPTMDDDLADLPRLERILGPIRVDMSALRRLPSQLRQNDFRGKAIVSGGRLLDFVPAADTSACLVAAFDIGTTTLVGALYDSQTGDEKARVSRINPQTSFGDDILTRITFASTMPEGLGRLQKEVVGAVNAMLGELAREAGVSLDRIFEIVFAGNTTMQHLLAGLDPGALGLAPFVPAISHALETPASDLGLELHPAAHAYVLPVIGGFVGGDTVAGILATNLDACQVPTLFIDIGTNGEIVIVADGKLISTSCAAGPAFEGAKISHGMRAASGAIEIVEFNDDVHYRVIGGVQPIGLCGSALIDLAAELLRCGILTREGFFLNPEDIASDVPEPIRRRLRRFDDGLGFVLAADHETQTNRPVVLTQRDVRELQLATGAVRSGVAIMLKRAGLSVHDLEAILVAGAFGNYIRCVNAQRIGLLPAEIDPSRIAFVGNTSMSGARRTVLSLSARRKTEVLAKQTRHIDLSLDPEFQDVFIDALFFPEALLPTTQP